MPGPTAGSRRRGQPWSAGALVLLFAAVAVGVMWWWHRPNLAQRVHAAIPKPPDLTGQPAGLAELLAKAEIGTKTSADPLASVAELGRL